MSIETKALVKDGVVFNIILIDTDDPIDTPDGMILVDAGNEPDAAPGHLWDGSKFVRPSIDDSANAWESLRRQRNEKLSKTDWWALSDMTMSDAQTEYRQALRDLPENTENPMIINWPTKP
jgi:hypothetical protein